MRKFTSLLCCLLVFCLVFLTACDETQQDPSSDSTSSSTSNSTSNSQPSSPNESSPSSLPQSESDPVPTVMLSELTNTGAISYDNFLPYNNQIYYTPGNEFLSIAYERLDTPGYCDPYGNPVITNLPAGSGTNFSEGLAVFTETKSNTDSTIVAEHLINANGNVVFTFPEIPHKVSPYQNGHFITLRYSYEDDGPYSTRTVYYIGIVDKNLNFTETELHSSLNINSTEFARWQFINNPDFVGAVGPYYDQTRQEQRLGLVDQQGKLVYSCPAKLFFNSIESNFSVVNIGREGGSSVISDIYFIDYTKILFPQNGYLNVMNDAGFWGLMNLTTQTMAIDYKYDYVGGCYDGKVSVCLGGKWGVVDTKDTQIIPCQPTFQYIGNFVNNRAIALNDQNKVCIIDSAGTIIKTMELNISHPTLSGSRAAFYYTDFSPVNGISCIYSYDEFYIISSQGDILLSSEPQAKDTKYAIYMNNRYLVYYGKQKTQVFEIICS